MEGGFQTDKERPQGLYSKEGFWLDWFSDEPGEVSSSE